MTIENANLSEFLDALALTEQPLGICFRDESPANCLSPKPGQPPSRELEAAGEMDWPGVFQNFSCLIGHIWRARKKRVPACFSPEQYGCVGGSFFLGFHKPQVEGIIGYVSSGVPGWSKGERYCESPDALRRVFDGIDPCPAPARYCVVQPLELFGADEEPEFVLFFARPESLCGLHQLAFFATNDPEVVASPWGATCTSIVTWPMRYRAEGRERAVVGGWDPSARKFLKTDELSFTVPLGLYRKMLGRWKESFLAGEEWQTTRRKALRSRRAWGEDE